MIYYTWLILFVFIIYFFVHIVKNRISRGKIFFLIITLIVILFQGFRDFTVGIDILGYLEGYLSIGHSSISNLHYQNYEVGYVVLNKLLFILGINKRGFLIILAAIIQIPIFYTFYKYSENYLLSIFWYFSFGNFLMTFSGLRQSIVMALCFFAYRFIKNKNLYKFICIIIFASLFHKSAMFCLLLYPLYYLNIDKRKIIIIFAVLLSLFLMKEKFLIIAGKLYKGRIVPIEHTGAYTMFIFYLVLYLYSLMFQSRDKDYRGLRNILFLLLLTFIFAPIHWTFTRISYPLTLYMCLFIPKLLKTMDKKYQLVYKVAILTFEILSFYYLLGTLQTLPFKFG
ncbi:EpsG family protein [uncultured Fusobacterium sp.]|uniref:EpsG family protein n=1 Tax=uncultured Fusobacterium sp. TaxID=159267 RepID=UPI002598C3B9|nr:EpsG family protein [uncultured Fusobacterium sp.]